MRRNALFPLAARLAGVEFPGPVGAWHGSIGLRSNTSSPYRVLQGGLRFDQTNAPIKTLAHTANCLMGTETTTAGDEVNLDGVSRLKVEMIV
jgi:hypothetical protein